MTRFAVLLACFSTGCGDSSTYVKGQINDAEGRSIPEADVVLEWSDGRPTPKVIDVKSDAGGNYTVNVPFKGNGPLTLKVTKSGYKPYSEVITPDGKTLVRNIVLEADLKKN
jgi:hypothetical protein